MEEDYVVVVTRKLAENIKKNTGENIMPWGGIDKSLGK